MRWRQTTVKRRPLRRVGPLPDFGVWARGGCLPGQTLKTREERGSRGVCSPAGNVPKHLRTGVPSEIRSRAGSPWKGAPGLRNRPREMRKRGQCWLPVPLPCPSHHHITSPTSANWGQRSAVSKRQLCIGRISREVVILLSIHGCGLVVSGAWRYPSIHPSPSRLSPCLSTPPLC